MGIEHRLSDTPADVTFAIEATYGPSATTVRAADCAEFLNSQRRYVNRQHCKLIRVTKSQTTLISELAEPLAR